MTRWLEFTVGDAFPADSKIAQWVAVLALVSNDLIFTTKHFDAAYLRAHPDQRTDTVYFAWLALSHFAEANKILRLPLDDPEIGTFIDSLDPSVRALYDEIHPAFEPWKDSFTESILKLRNTIWHYPKPGKEMEKALRDLESKESSIRLDGSHVGEVRAVLGDDIRTALATEHLGADEAKIREALAILGDLVGNIARFSSYVATGYLRSLPKGSWTTREGDVRPI
jgi:hypothetical protein